MKKLLSFLCVLSILVGASCTAFVPPTYSSSTASSSSSTGLPPEHAHYDNDGDDTCDLCSMNLPHVHRDADNNEICDNCKISLHEHTEVNGYCSACGALLHTHVDENGYCTICNATLHEHEDANKDGECDVCFISMQTSVSFYSVNDLHGKFDIGKMTTYLRNAQTTNENTVILSAGDMWQGSMQSNATKGNIITDWMNDVGFAAMALGNHEFDWGEAPIEANAKLASFPFLAINVYDKDTDERVDYCDASVMIETNGVKIGVIGAIGDCYSSIASEHVQDVYFKTRSQLTTLVKAESVRLREQGADMIVYLLHDGSESTYNYDPALSNGYVDMVFEGHTHQSVHEQDRYGVWHLQAGGDNKIGLSHAKFNVTLGKLGKTVYAETAKIINKSTYAGLQDDPIIQQLLTKYAPILEPLSGVLGTNASYRNYDALGEYAAKSYFALGMSRWGNDEKYKGKIVLGGGYIGIRSPYKLYAGDVTYNDLYPIFPFDNALVLCKVSGSRLKAQFINSTNSKYYMYYGVDGTQIKKNIVDSETYYVVVDTYCANYNFYGYGYLEIVEYYDESRTYFGRDAIVDYTRGGGLSATPPSPETFTPVR